MKGISTNDFPEVLPSLVGVDAKGLSGKTNIPNGRIVLRAKNGTSTCGPTAFTATFDSTATKVARKMRIARVYCY